MYSQNVRVAQYALLCIYKFICILYNVYAVFEKLNKVAAF